MAMNLDVNKIRSITRGEVSGSVRFLVLAMCAAAAWIGSSWLSGMAGSASSSLTLSQARYEEIGRLAAEYRAIAPVSAPDEETDVMTAFTQVSSGIELGSRVSRISPMPDGQRCVVEINRLYAEELEKMVRELAARGVQVLTAEIFTVPVGEERLFRLSLTIGSET